MSYRPQRDPFDDGMQSLISAMNVSHRVPGAKEPDMQSLGKKIINNARTRPEFARKVTELYTNEDSWLSNFLRKEIAATKTVPKAEYFGGSPNEKTVAVGDSINATSEENVMPPGVFRTPGEMEEGAGEEAPTDQSIVIKEVEGEITQDEFETKTNLTDEDKVRAFRSLNLLPQAALNVEIVKKGKSSSIKIYVENAEAARMCREEFMEMQKTLMADDYKDPRFNNVKKLIKFALAKNNNVIQVKPTNLSYVSPPPKKVTARGRSTKPSGGTRSRSSSGSKRTPASEAVSMSLNEKPEEYLSEVVVKD
jgi:hypothetical protein